MSVVTLIMAVTLVLAISILTTVLAYLTLIVGVRKILKKLLIGILTLPLGKRQRSYIEIIEY